MIPDLTDTIAAIGSANGGAARGIIRLSGAATMSCLKAFFRPTIAETELSTTSSPRLVVGELKLNPDVVPLPCDLFLWPDARSYTRQLSAELHTVGSPPLLEKALDTICKSGARIAEPGEFTLRAFLAGRLDLTQAEAVLGVIDSTNRSSLDASLGQLAGGLSKPLGELRDQLLQLLAQLEAGLDFVEEDISFISTGEIERQLQTARELVKITLAQLANRGQSNAMPKIVLAGKPNVGKSSLFNAIVERHGVEHNPVDALVSNRAGTTRDYLIATIELSGRCYELVDTAGLDGDHSDETVSYYSQENAHDQKRRADCTVLCVDLATVEPADVTGELAACKANGPVILVATKSDLVGCDNRLPQSEQFMGCSSLTGQGLTKLTSVIVEELSKIDSTSGVAPTANRCIDCLRRADESLTSALAAVAEQGGDELISADIRIGLHEIGRVVGAVYTDDVLDRIFSQFCIGK